jgi:hypothetical protein
MARSVAREDEVVAARWGRLPGVRMVRRPKEPVTMVQVAAAGGAEEEAIYLEAICTISHSSENPRSPVPGCFSSADITSP